MKFRWSVLAPQPLLAGQLANQLHIPPLLAHCLLNRELSSTEAVSSFLQPRLKHLADPFLLPGMKTAVERLWRAQHNAEPIVIFGDYDVDGVTSTALLLEVLRPLGWRVECYLPNRMDEGYGLSPDAVENCLKRFTATLLLAVDCGSTSFQTIASLRARGVDVIVLDHHQVCAPAPAATALVNPQVALTARLADHAPAGQPEGGATREGQPKGWTTNPNGPGSQPNGFAANGPPFAELCSVGLAFKLAHAVVKQGRQTGLPGAREFDLRKLLDLVALGTIADLVPLIGENRILVSAGLQRLNSTERPGLVALKQVSQCPKALGGYEVGFQLAPRLNAAGRLQTAEEALRLLRVSEPAQAMPLALRLDAHNRERQKIERTIADEVVHAVRARFNPETDYVIVEGNASWHIGVLGIVASRVLQQFYRPTIIVGGEGEEWRGSGRSIAGFDLATALRACSELLIRHGGHALAAGVTIHRSKLDEFRSRLNELARRSLSPEALQPLLRLDGEVGLEEISFDCLAQLERLRPTGQGNPPVQFLARNLTHLRPLQRVGPGREHVKMWITDGTTSHEALWWGAGKESLPVGRFDLAFIPQLHQYNGRQLVQLKVLDWRQSQ